MLLDLIHKFLNLVAPPVSFFSLLLFLPPFQFFKFFLSILGTLFSEDVAGKVVIITGASSGIGEYLAYEYAKRGACLTLAARRERSLNEVAERARDIGSPDVITVDADVSKTDDCRRIVDQTMTHFGRLDHLVNNAGVHAITLFEDTEDVTDFKSVMDINFWGSVYMTRFSIPYLRYSGGRIIVLSSSASWLPAPRSSFYNASKAAISLFFETLRIELGQDIKITLVTPGFVESELTQGKYIGKGGDVEVDPGMRDEKHGAKVKEKLDKCVKEKLLFFCDILNIPVSRSAAKKDELSVKLLDFLESPHSTTDSFLADKEQKRKSKGKTSKSKGSLDKAAGKSAKKHQKSEGEKHKRSSKTEEDETDDEPLRCRDEPGDDNDDEEGNEVGSDQEESGSEEEKSKKKKSNGNVSSKKDSGNKVTEKPKAVKKDNPAKSPKSSTKSTKVSSITASKRGVSGADSLVTPKRQKVEKKSIVKENASSKKQSTKSPVKVSEKEGKGKSGKKAKEEPSNEEIHAAVVNILKEVDFNSVSDDLVG